MSHFSLIVALPPGSDVEAELAARLAPYDENQDVAPYPNYEEGDADDFWWYRSLKRAAETVANEDHSQIRRMKTADDNGWSTEWSEKTPEEQWADFRRNAEIFHSLPNPATWEALVPAYNRYFCDGDPYTDGTRLYYDPESGKAYEFSTYNPKSKWDYWRVGGRWARYFPVLPQVIPEVDDRVITTDLSWEWREASPEERAAMLGKVEGGPKGLLDLDRLRYEKVQEAAEKWDKFHAFAADYPPAKGWKQFLAERGSDEPIERTRELYAAQPLVQAIREHPDYRFYWGSPIDEFSGEREDYLRKARRDAVPGYALLTLDGEWVAPGEMGWFGMSSDDDDSMETYKNWANEYIDNLDDDVILVVLDLHI
jgi:hypothetical protein